MLAITCPVQQYAWGKLGSSSTVAQLQAANPITPGVVNDAEPYAEYWFGTHHKGPARIASSGSPESKDGSGRLLSQWLVENQGCLGSMLERRDGRTQDGGPADTLPYLAKVLSIAKCLSIQAHPDKQLAERLHSERPEVYKDPNHKPEMAIALTDFEAMCGFRALSEIVEFVDSVPEFRAVLGANEAGSPGAVAVAGLREAADGVDMRSHLKNLFAVYANADKGLVEAQVQALVNRATQLQLEPEATTSDPSGRQLAVQLAVRLADQFPGDVGVFAPFFLNYLRLTPGQAIFLAANEPHAYISGDCFETMARSDNVVRMGCTPKLRDVPVLTEMLSFKAGMPTILEGTAVHDHVRVYTPGDAAVDEFQVENITIDNATGQATASVTVASADTPSIWVVLSGSGSVAPADATGATTHQLQRGTLLFEPAGQRQVVSTLAGGSLQCFRVHCRQDPTSLVVEQ